MQLRWRASFEKGWKKRALRFAFGGPSADWAAAPFMLLIRLGYSYAGSSRRARAPLSHRLSTLRRQSTPGCRRWEFVPIPSLHRSRATPVH